MSTDRTDLVSISELTRRLKAKGIRIDRSTVSRYVTRHADALNPVQQGKEALVSEAAFLAHRGENINIADERPYQAPKAGAVAKARREQADAELREIELGKTKLLLTPTSEVTEAAAEAIGAMNAAFDMALQKTAERLGSGFGLETRLVRPYLRGLRETALEEFRRTLVNALRTATELEQERTAAPARFLPAQLAFDDARPAP